MRSTPLHLRLPLHEQQRPVLGSCPVRGRARGGPRVVPHRTRAQHALVQRARATHVPARKRKLRQAAAGKEGRKASVGWLETNP
jgi:hypothetical protein